MGAISQENEMILDKTLQGNCFDLFPNLSDKSVDFVFTSPPYNRKRNDKYTFYNDTLCDYYDFLKQAIEQSLRVAKKSVIFNLQINYYNSADIYKLMGYFSEQIRHTFIWEKTNPLPASGNNITNAYEIFLVMGEKTLKSNSTYTKNVIHTSVNNRMPSYHKAVMHPDVAQFFIEHFTNEGDIILDPFMGTGTTGRICKELNRHYIGFELVREYCEKANETEICEIGE
jgi:site-specific DNA-methyltransferase (adenine-specific)